MNNVHIGARMVLKSQKARITAMFAVLVLVAVVVVFGDIYDYGGSDYIYWPQDSGYHYYDYYGYDDHYGYYDPYGDEYRRDMPYGDVRIHFDAYNSIARGYGEVFLSDFEVHDYERGLRAFGDNLYYICFESMGAYLIGPRTGQLVTFHFNDGTGRIAQRTTAYTGPGGHWIGSGPGRMPATPFHPDGLTPLGWHTTDDGRLGAGSAPEFGPYSYVQGDIDVFMIWGVHVFFNTHITAFNPGSDPSDINHFVPRMNIPVGWSVDEVSARDWGTIVWPRDLDGTDRPGGFVFWGWYDSPAPPGGTAYTGADPIMANTTLHARWTTLVPPTVTFVVPPANQVAGHQYTRQAHYGFSVNDSNRTLGVGQPLPIATGVVWPRSAPDAVMPSRTLEGWWTAAGGGGNRWAPAGYIHFFDHGPARLPVPMGFADTPVTEDINVYPHWVYRVIFHPNQGSQHPQPDGFISLADGAGNPLSPGTLSHILFRDIAITYPSGTVLTINNHGRQYRAFEYIDVFCPIENEMIRERIPVDAMVDRPYIPEGFASVAADNDISRPGFTFNGWWTVRATPEQNPAAMGGVPFDGDTPVTASTTVYAHWIRNPGVFVTFDPSGGEWYFHLTAFIPFPRLYGILNTSDVHVVDVPGIGPGSPHGGRMSATDGPGNPGHRGMPTMPRKPGHTFIGWFSDPWDPNENYALIDRGTHFTEQIGQNFYRSMVFTSHTLVTEDITVYAHWVPAVRIDFIPQGAYRVQTTRPTPPTWAPALQYSRYPYRMVGYGHSTNTGSNPNDHWALHNPAPPPPGTNFWSWPGAAGTWPRAASPANLLPHPQTNRPIVNFTTMRGQGGWGASGATSQGTHPMRLFDWNNAIGGMNIPYFRRPGFVPLPNQWQWWAFWQGRITANYIDHSPNVVWANPVAAAQGGAATTAQTGTAFNTRHDGSSTFVGQGQNFGIHPVGHADAGEYIDRQLAPYWEYDEDNIRYLHAYSQWGVSVRFHANVATTFPNLVAGFPSFLLTRDSVVPDGRSFDNRHWTISGNRHMPPSFPSDFITTANPTPASPHLPAAQGGLGWGTAVFTHDFPNPASPNPADPWAHGLATQVDINDNPIGQSFVGWNTQPDGTGYWLRDTDTLPLRDANDQPILGTLDPSQNYLAQYRLNVYGIWETGDVLTFCVGDGPAGVVWPAGWPSPLPNGRRELRFTLGIPHPAPPASPYDPTGTYVFLGWQGVIPVAGGNPILVPFVLHQSPIQLHFDAGHFYAQWGTRVYFEPNAADATLVNPLIDYGDFPVGGPGQLIYFLRQCVPTRGGVSSTWEFGRWNTLATGRGITAVPDVSPNTEAIPFVNEQRRLFAQWDGMFDFNLDGGALNNSTNNVQIWIPEGFTIAEVGAATGADRITQTTRLQPGATPAPNINIADRAVMPNNPTHPDLSMVFMGWRITSIPAYADRVFTRTEVENLVMNGHIDNDENNPRNAPNGQITFDAVWHQRLLFTVTGEHFNTITQRIESLYLIHPDTANINRVIHPRDGAIFKLERQEYDPIASDYVWVLVQNNMESGNVVLGLGAVDGAVPFVPELPAQTGRVATINPLTPNAIYRLTEVQPPLGYRREGIEGGIAGEVWRWLISTEPFAHTVTFDLNSGNINGNTADVLLPVPHMATIGNANMPNPSHSWNAFGGWTYFDDLGNFQMVSWQDIWDGFFDTFVVTRDITFTAIWLGIGRSLDDEIDLSSIVPMSGGASIDTRITWIRPLHHDLYFFDTENEVRGYPITMYTNRDWHVGNRRPRFNFTKLDSNNLPLGCDDDDIDNGAIFVIERRTRLDDATPWDDWDIIYTTQPSGSIAVPLLPAQPGPVNTPAPGMVVVTRPIFAANIDSFDPDTLTQYRLREIYAPSGYLIPLGYWLISTNRYSGVSTIAPAPTAPGSIVPGFGVVPSTPPQPSPVPGIPDPVHPRPWDVDRYVRNIPTRHWPFLKTDGHLFSDTVDHSYLPDAAFMLFVYNGPGTPASNLLVTPYDMFDNSSGTSPWTYVTTQTSNSGPPRDPMWFPMMPGRTYQLVEVFAPVGYAVPWGQWRFTVLGAVCIDTIAGTELGWQLIGSNVPNIRRMNTIVPRGNIHANAGDYCCDDVNCDFTCNPNMPVYHIPNMPDFNLPLAGGTGVSIVITIAGTLLTGLGFIALFLRAKRFKENII